MKIYNSLTRIKEEFAPLKKGHVGMYVCGPTVYDEPHIGHARSAYIFDVIRRCFEYKKYDVVFVRNVTDVDDKIIDKARKELGTESDGVIVIEKTKEIATKYLDAYHEDMALLGIRPPDKEPKATVYVPKMVKFIESLIALDKAYASGGDVYFDIKKVVRYGKLSNQNPEKMESSARIAPGEKKKDPMDFALWKKAKDTEPSWDSPWGQGRPGWHIECSAMSSDILGDEFDIHGGGIDLIFPHHENEIAQSEGAGNKFAKYWIHNGLLTIKNEKMAKSLGNFISIKAFMAEYNDSDLLKLLFLNTHYRHPVDYTEEKIAEMRAQKQRIIILMEKLGRKRRTENGERKENTSGVSLFRKQFEDAIDDDFNMPLGLAAIFELVTETNKKIDDLDFTADAKKLLLDMAGVFGLNISSESKEDDAGEIDRFVAARNVARAKKDFKEADRIRRVLDEKGVILEDTKDGTTWRKKL
ncbi:MAG: cysteine--tRNA ligase [Candidatus Omnitrophota bacterium]